MTGGGRADVQGFGAARHVAVVRKVGAGVG